MKKKYSVAFTVHASIDMTVEANSEEEARELAEQQAVEPSLCHNRVEGAMTDELAPYRWVSLAELQHVFPVQEFGFVETFRVVKTPEPVPKDWAGATALAVAKYLNGQGKRPPPARTIILTTK